MKNPLNSLIGGKVKSPWYDNWKIMECVVCKTLKVNTKVMPAGFLECKKCGESNWIYVSNERRFEMKGYD